MPYKIGISAGWWKIGKDPALLGLAQKFAGWGGTAGVQFIQADIDTTSEFYEPLLKQQMKRVVKEMGIEGGLHGEEGELMSLESAEKRLWEQSHLRLIETVKHSVDFGMTLVNIHSSNTLFISFVEAQHRLQGYYYPVVGPDGRPLTYLGKENPETKEEAKKHVSSIIERSATWDSELDKLKKSKYAEIEKRVREIIEKERKQGRAVDETAARNYVEQQIRIEINEIQNSKEFQYSVLEKMSDSDHEKYLLNDGEYGAYIIAATYMRETNDPLWSTIAGGGKPEDTYTTNEKDFCAAISAKYIEGHLRVKDHPLNKKHLDGMSILEYLEKSKTHLLFETPQTGEGREALMRMFDPLHIYYMIKKINSPRVKMCIDFEHMLAHKLNPDTEIPKYPGDIGKEIMLFHLGKPIPYWGTAHIPIAIGSRAQEIIYKWLYMIRKKGFKDGYMIFERGGGRSGKGNTPLEVVESSVWALRQIKEYLEKDTKPDELPEAFYGVAEQNKETWARQLVNMREHAWDPLEGLLTIPEEKHTFLGKAATDKGKAKEWDRAKYR